MISKAQQKHIRQLGQKKFRTAEGLFVAEGPKVVGDLLAEGFQAECVIDDEDDVAKVSFLHHPQGILGVFRIPDNKQLKISSDELTLMLDGIQDPGNMGTIIRIADWFGIRQIVCSTDTVDAYNPKVVQATMGSIARVRLFYRDLPTLLASLPAETAIYGTLLDGEDIYRQQLSPSGIIIMGNEGNGISQEVRPFITHRLLIPSFGNSGAESLNVAVATAITCSEFKRTCRL